ncbi:MAG: YdeI/OmpD-associated family protein [Caldilineaceae bacterium]|nr:YdeI/OmpD-associated family protein [Caldilineaceae bacterium]HRJ41534.1 YdeI/OmpD-associated family protein [Caldilineaceae bacterium]
MNPEHFETVIEKADSKAIIRLPFDPNAVWGEKDRHHITGAVNGCSIRGALGQDADGYFLSPGPAWLRDIGLDVGAAVQVELRPEGPQMEQLADDITAALEAEPEALAFFQGLATFYRKGYLRWIDATKRRPELRAERIAEVIGLLKAGEKQR